MAGRAASQCVDRQSRGTWHHRFVAYLAHTLPCSKLWACGQQAVSSSSRSATATRFACRLSMDRAWSAPLSLGGRAGRASPAPRAPRRPVVVVGVGGKRSSRLRWRAYAQASFAVDGHRDSPRSQEPRRPRRRSNPNRRPLATQCIHRFSLSPPTGRARQRLATRGGNVSGSWDLRRHGAVGLLCLVCGPNKG